MTETPEAYAAPAAPTIQSAPHADAHAEALSQDETVPRTGHDEVDVVLDSLVGLDDLPVDGHVAVFEQAHDRLRRALADAGPAAHG